MRRWVIFIIVVLVLAGTVAFRIRRGGVPVAREEQPAVPAVPPVSTGSFNFQIPTAVIPGVVPAAGSVTGAAGGQAYRNAAYGVSFQYPDGFAADNEAPVGFPLLFEAVFSLADGSQRVSASVYRQGCLPAGLAGAAAASSSFAQAAFFLGPELRDFRIDGYQAKVFKRGCYECYEGDERLGMEGVVLIACNRGEAACFRLSMEGPEAAYALVQKAFLDDVLPSVKLDSAFGAVKCFDARD